MNKSLTILLLIFACTACNAQNKDLDSNSEENITLYREGDTLENEPEVNIKVDKKYDDDGNLIGYDSTYSYSYHSYHGDPALMDMDSVFNRLQPFFRGSLRSLPDDPFADFFEMDSMFYNHSFKDRYFQRRFKQQFEEFENKFKEMDSVKNSSRDDPREKEI